MLIKKLEVISAKTNTYPHVNNIMVAKHVS